MNTTTNTCICNVTSASFSTTTTTSREKRKDAIFSKRLVGDGGVMSNGWKIESTCEEQGFGCEMEKQHYVVTQIICEFHIQLQLQVV